MFSVFAYPYLVFQSIGGLGRGPFRRATSVDGCGRYLATATVMIGLVSSLTSMIAARVLLGFGEGATFPVATHAMADWTPPSKRGYAQGITHSTERLGNAVTPPLAIALRTPIPISRTLTALTLECPETDPGSTDLDRR